MAVAIRDSDTGLSLTGGYEMANLVTGWRKNCFTFKTESQLKVGIYTLSSANELANYLYKLFVKLIL